MSTSVRRHHDQEDTPDPSRPTPGPPASLPFQPATMHRPGALAHLRGGAMIAAEHATRALEALNTMSRRMDDLARELNCLGYFDDDDRPRAA